MFLGANLASVHSSEESQFLQAVVLIKTGDFPLTWIGGYEAVQANVEKVLNLSYLSKSKNT